MMYNNLLNNWIGKLAVSKFDTISFIFDPLI